MQLVNSFKSAAQGYGTERRVLLLHGPVGSSKSTIARLLKRGLEEYSRTDKGSSIPTPGRWTTARGNGPDARGTAAAHPAGFAAAAARTTQRQSQAGRRRNRHQGRFEPLLPANDARTHGPLRRRLEQGHGGHQGLSRLILSEQDRIGIGTFQPKDEKNQDSTELTGDINYRKIAEYGTDRDPRAFNFDGELNIANRGIVEFIEVLKLDVAFLYDLLGASQEHKIKPKKFAQTDIDEVILGHTNEPEYNKLQNNEFMEALRDRTMKIDIPYVIRLSDEIKIYEKDFNSDKVRGKHIAPHTIEVAAMWAVLTRLEPPKQAGLTLLQKLKLYNGKTLPGFTEDNVNELKREARQRRHAGHQPALHPGQDLQRAGRRTRTRTTSTRSW